jgi:hypothetical protein
MSAWIRPAHDNLVALVDKILESKRREHDEPNPQVKSVIKISCASLRKQTRKQAEGLRLDGQIDRLVYELYNLSGEEIKTVEGEG